jgi:predicted dithiol-disulfide oxidoreductase (DUF899 family)
MNIGHLSNESDTYRRTRDDLLMAEIELRDQREKVASLRRQLPLDTKIDDYVFTDGSAKKVRLSELFARPDAPLVLYHYMYGEAQVAPCPMCSLVVDSFAGITRHIGQTMNFAVVVAGDTKTIQNLGSDRGWQDLHVLSCAGSSFKTDLGFQTDTGDQMPGVTVVVRADDGTLRHAYSGSAILGPKEGRGMDLFMPVWHLLDLTPQGRGTWNPSLSYG